MSKTEALLLPSGRGNFVDVSEERPTNAHSTFMDRLYELARETGMEKDCSREHRVEIRANGC